MVNLGIRVVAAQRNMVEYDVGRGGGGCEAEQDNRRLHAV